MMKPVELLFRIQLPADAILEMEQAASRALLHPTKKPGEYLVSRRSLNFLQENRITFRKIRSYSKKAIPVKIEYPSHSILYEPPHPEAQEEVLAKAFAMHPGRKRIQVLYMGRGKDLSKNSFILDRAGGKRSYQWRINRTPKRIRDIRSLFPRMAAHIKDKDTKVILSFGSGGVRLFAHPSLMKFIDLLDLRDHVSEIWGSSGGAIAGLFYSLGVEPSVMEQEGYHLYNDRYSFKFSPSKKDVILNLIFDLILPSGDRLLKGFMDCQESLRTLMEKHLKPIKKIIPFYCLAYNLVKKRTEILTPEKVRGNSYEPPIVHTNPMDAVIASSSIPIIYVPKKIFRQKSEHLYIDGGTTEEVPLISPYGKWLRDRAKGQSHKNKLLLITVNLFPQVGNSVLFSNWIFKKLPAFRLLQLSATYADLIRQARIEDHKHYLKRDPRVELWELNLPLSGASILNPKVIPTVIETARRSFFQQLFKIEKELARKKT